MWWTEGTWPWLAGWLESPGFAGAVALVAAAVTITVSMRKNRHETWWEQTEWALGKYVNDGGSEIDRSVAADAISFLVRSPLATKHEADFLSAVMAKETFERRQPEPGALDPTAVVCDANPGENGTSTEEGT